MEERICPFMSYRHGTSLTPVFCEKERCKAWGETPTFIDHTGNGMQAWKLDCKLINGGLGK